MGAEEKGIRRDPAEKVTAAPDRAPSNHGGGNPRRPPGAAGGKCHLERQFEVQFSIDNMFRDP